MRTAVVSLLALLVALAPVTPTVGAQTQTGEGDGRGAAYHYGGDHVALDVDPELPGIRNLTLLASGERVIDAIELPGDEFTDGSRDSELRLQTGTAELRIRDEADLPGRLEADGDAPILVQVTSGVAIQEANASEGPGIVLAPSTGPSLVLAGDEITREERTLTLSGDTDIHARNATPSSGNASDEDTDDEDAAPEGPGGSDRDDGGAPADAGPGDRNRSGDQAGDEGPGRDDNRSQGEDRGRDAADRDRSKEGTASDGPYKVGPIRFELSGDRILDLTIRDDPILAGLQLPGLDNATVRDRGNQLRLESDQARLEIRADGGLLLRAQADGPVSARLAEGAEVRTQDEDDAFVRVGQWTFVLEGEDLAVDDRRLTVQEELRLAGRTQAQAREDPVWRAEDRPAAAALPYTVEGRYISFTLTERSIENLTIHGTPVGSILFASATVEEIGRRGVHIHAEGEGLEVDANDAPATQLTVEARNLTTDLPARTTLPSGARVTTSVDGDEVRVRVDRPAGLLANRTLVDHRPSQVPVEPAEGPHPGLRALTDGGALGVTSSRPDTLATRFDGSLNGTEGNVSLNLGLVRAMLIDDTDGNNRVDVGEPAIAQRGLSNGTTTIRGDELVNRFPLWQGNLTVTVEPGNETAKITYEVSNLSAPPGTLFVLETEIGAPSGASIQPTDDGAIVENGPMQARYAAAGPVTVDGSAAWADRSIFIDSEGTVSVLLAYPAGDNITHDPTVAVQSIPGAQVVSQLAASPYAILAGALSAGVLVGATVWARRRGRPPT